MLKDNLYNTLPEADETPVYYPCLLVKLKEEGITATLAQVYPLLLELQKEKKVQRTKNSFGKALWKKQ